MEKKCIALVDDVVGAMERMMEDTKKEMMEMKNLSSQMPPSSGANLTQPSYTGVLAPNPAQPRSTPLTAQQTLQSTLENTLAKEEIKSKQVLLTSDREFPACLETELVEHANTAILEMGEDYAGYEAVGVKKLQSGGIVFEMNSREAAEILQSTDVKDLFAENFGGGVEVKPRSYPVVVDHVLTSFRITLKTQELEYQVIEEHNNLPGGSIVDARWIKPPSQRSSTQTTASLALHLNSAQLQIKLSEMVYSLQTRE
ncbi:hypothetical protein M422DRAFT_255570 [Sphaerobolus stellatus SS14]|uniref:Uncharacterized protein n=1 Tax=Sphaerobolus stellatus (strain SS14) TaxID=990650 RepID=A0A0C9V339_SPHS4|nr:hypothetical protein M422DRAFT_255570 [Sphaerobolus stellatus SS14]